MTVRGEVAQPPGKTGTWSPEQPRQTGHSPSRLRGASLPAEDSSPQRIRDCSRSAHEECGLGWREKLDDDGAIHPIRRGADLRYFGQGIQRGLIKEQTAG